MSEPDTATTAEPSDEPTPETDTAPQATTTTDTPAPFWKRWLGKA